MNYEIKKYSASDSIIWDKFVNNSINGTIFHERNFLNYHPVNRFKDNSLLFLEKGNLKSIFPAALIEKDGFKILKSHPGSSYGGLVIDRNLGVKKSFELVESLNEYAKNNKFDQIEFRQAEKIFNQTPCDELDFALLHNGFFREAEELSTCYDLTKYYGKKSADILSSFDIKARNKFRQSLKYNLKSRILNYNEVDSFYNLVEQNLKKHNAKPVHSAEDMKFLLNTYPERIKILGVFENDELIAGYFIFNINQLGWHIFYASLDYQKAELRPLNFGYINLVEYVISQGGKYLNYGISTENGGKIINWNLFEFKEAFAGSSILRTYWIKKI
ncbi:MAG: hypothetical protein NTW25_05140 [Candidatus Kapabacteria bacterium]|nr:hypothetical protein [Candidatus Kapabacteria bacterium]